ncbi:hypothetical protein V6N12_022757 [Hibiscus sabdariffa]|uniref:Uncharacterized protein n=1 Tax=Hibiscus sabdariffa TaxID=183260 RepID=A0ABR2FVU1_9ROSI
MIDVENEICTAAIKERPVSLRGHYIQKGKDGVTLLNRGVQCPTVQFGLRGAWHGLEGCTLMSHLILPEILEDEASTLSKNETHIPNQYDNAMHL